MKSFQEVYQRDKKLVFSIPLSKIQKALAIVLVLFSTLTTLDIITTLYNLNYVEGAYEANIILSPLLQGNPLEVFVAILIKIEIVAILILIYTLKGKSSLVTRIIKLGTLSGLLAVIPIYMWIIGVNISIMVQ